MSLWGLVKRSLCFYWRTSIAVLLAAAASTAVLVGALVVGDSVRYSLRRMVTARLGRTQLALVGGSRFFRAELADELAPELNTTVAPVVQLRGLVSNSDATRRANRIQVLGVDKRFYTIGAGANPFDDDWGAQILLNKPLADKLGLGVGDEVVLRVERPGIMPRDVPLMPDSHLSMAFRLVVKAVVEEPMFGRFSLHANQIVPLNAYLPIRWLQEQLGLVGRANLLLVEGNAQEAITVEKANRAVRKCWQLADAGLQLRRLKKHDTLEVRSSRIFIDEPLTETAMNAADEAVGVLTYFVNELRSGDKATPYSMVTAMGPSTSPNSLIPKDVQDDEILINRWLADDLGAGVGDLLELTYFVVGPMRRLYEQKSGFRIRKIVPVDHPQADTDLMPDFPGLADVENCRDWEPGISIDLDKIRKCDEDYWQRYRGTPKAFVTLSAGQAMWANRYGNLTAVRYPSSSSTEENLARRLLSSVDPASAALYFQPVRARGLKAGDQATDFGQLFLGFSIFLIIAALLLTGLLFVFGVENRSEQTGMLLAVGYSPTSVKRLLLIEGAVLAVGGAIAGTLTGLLYTKSMIYGLATIWRVAVSSSIIHFHVTPSTLFIGAAGGIAISLTAIWFTFRKQVSRPARELLAGNLRWQFFTAKPLARAKAGLWVAALAAAGAALLLMLVRTGRSSVAAGSFFGAGALLLTAGLGLTHASLKIIGGGCRRPAASLAGLGLRNSTRRCTRSLTVVALLACGIFLVIAIGANRHDPLAHAHRRDSGTGGFALFGESTISILHDLNSESGHKSLGLDRSELQGVEIVQLRVHDGDDASCFNLNRAQTPRLLGVQPRQFQIRGAFEFTDTSEEAKKQNGWRLLDGGKSKDVVPAIGDYATITWALGKSVGDELEYTDEKGRGFRLRLVGMIRSSVLQGSLVISEDEFVRLYPSEDGYRVFLVDVTEKKVQAAAETLSSALKDFGLELKPAAERLAEFNAVENTYLSIFQLLGGLGLVLGSVGLGLVVLRNVLERRSELAMLQAVGFSKGVLRQMIFYEHSGLMLAGLMCGVAAALVAVLPALRSLVAKMPYFSLALTVAAIAASSLIWIRIATASALSGKLLDALRNE